MEQPSTIDTGDVVLHVPTGEEWLVAYVKGDRLAWCGWPCGEAAIADCTLLSKAPEKGRAELLASMAAITESDPRATYARNRLADAAAVGPA